MSTAGKLHGFEVQEMSSQEAQEAASTAVQDAVNLAMTLGYHVRVDCVPGPGDLAMGNHCPKVVIWPRKVQS